jgi:site-specific recombinase XerD
MTRTSTASVSDIGTLATSYGRHLRASNRSPATVKTYAEATDQLETFLVAAGMPTNVIDIHREHVEAFVLALIDSGRAPATCSNRYRALVSFFKWLVDEGEIIESPMRRMTPPHVPETPPPVLTADEIGALLKDCAGKGFENKRDTAIIRLFASTGMRRAELLRLTLDDLDLDARQAHVIGKGRRARACPFNNRTAQALDRYLRERARHPNASSPALWLGRRGGFNESGIATMLRRRGARAGIGPVHPHQFRHYAAHTWLAGGGSEVGLMSNLGWRGRDMVARYAASTAAERGRDEHHRLALDDEL